MRLLSRFMAIPALFMLLSAFPAVSCAQGIRPPKTTLVEQPQEALRLWSGEKRRNATLLLISADIGITPLKEADSALTVKLLKDRDFEGLLGKGHPASRDYPVNPSNYIHAAHLAGLIDRVYWVPPTKEPVGAGTLENFKNSLKGQGAKDEELAGFRQSGNSIQGVLGGIPLYICGLKDLPELKEDVVMAVDLSYFSSIYQNEVKTPILDIFAGFITGLGGKKVEASGAVISYSTCMGHVPLKMRFLGRYLYAYFTGPDRLKDGPLPTWALRADGMYYETFFQNEDALGVYQEAVKLDPDDASLRYDLARAYSTVKDLDGLKNELDKAVAMDKSYYLAYIEYGQYFSNKGMPEVAEAFIKDALKADPEDPRCWDALYSVYYAGGDYQRAGEAVLKLIGLGFDWPGNFGLLADTYRRQGQYEKAVKTYGDALGKISPVERSARVGLLTELAETYEEDRKIEKALGVYREALDCAGDPDAKARIQGRIDALKKKWAPFLNISP